MIGFVPLRDGLGLRGVARGPPCGPAERARAEPRRAQERHPSRATCTSSPSSTGSSRAAGSCNRSDTGNAHVAPRVLPEKRGRGVGTALLQRLAAHAVERGYTRAGSHVAGRRRPVDRVRAPLRLRGDTARRAAGARRERRRGSRRPRASSSLRSRRGLIYSRPRTRSRRRATRTCRSRGSTSRSRAGSRRKRRFLRARSPRSPTARSSATPDCCVGRTIRRRRSTASLSSAATGAGAGSPPR